MNQKNPFNQFNDLNGIFPFPMYLVYIKIQYSHCDEVFESATNYVDDLSKHKFIYSYTNQNETDRMYKVICDMRRKQQIEQLKATIKTKKSN